MMWLNTVNQAANPSRLPWVVNHLMVMSSPSSLITTASSANVRTTGAL